MPLKRLELSAVQFTPWVDASNVGWARFLAAVPHLEHLTVKHQELDLHDLRAILTIPSSLQTVVVGRVTLDELHELPNVVGARPIIEKPITIRSRVARRQDDFFFGNSDYMSQIA
ncbi:hypothetical protein FRC07_010758, partial [Ceratobasidium sp. 392]